MITRTIAALVSALVIAGCGAPAPTPRPGTELKALSVRSASGQLELFKQPEAGAKPLIDLIDGAKKSIDFKIYMMSMSGPAADVVSALQRAARRGVAVRVIAEPFPFMPEGSKPGGYNAPAVKALLSAGAKVMYSRPEFKYTHEKSLVVDGTTTVMMTMNITKSSFTYNREFGVISRRSRDVEFVSRLFQADWVGEQPLVPINPHIVVSPSNAREQLAALVAGAQKSLVIESNSLKDPAIVALAAMRARGGADVKVLVAASRDKEGDYSTWRYLREAGISQIRFLEKPYLHAKMIIADGVKAYVGSENLTSNSLDNNRELGILVDDPAIVGELISTSTGDWAQAKSLDDPGSQPPATSSIPATLSAPVRAMPYLD